MESQPSASRSLFRKILGFFFQGLLLVAPISITLYVIWRVLVFFDGLIPLKIPGLGLLIVLAFITLAGAVGSLLIRTRLSKLVARLLDRVPLVRILYSSMQDLMSAFMGKKKKFTRPVLVVMNRENQLMKMGFLTEEDLSALGLGKAIVAVYMPHSYNFSGELFLVPADQVSPLDIPSAEAMKFIVSGGVTRV
ncbi:MAG: DUF502 domain-containing protein [Bacteroidales bacterium]|jgi:uncharacterized membrane protein|nr:DUF502 domain-containing protein [Bacteroidales bacterium]NLM92875.1 DUF502 domain-containing protein [Bacteroidales bacterium]